MKRKIIDLEIGDSFDVPVKNSQLGSPLGNHLSHLGGRFPLLNKVSVHVQLRIEAQWRVELPVQTAIYIKFYSLGGRKKKRVKPSVSVRKQQRDQPSWFLHQKEKERTFCWTMRTGGSFLNHLDCSATVL